MLKHETPIVLRSIDDDAHAQESQLSEASLRVMAQEVITRLTHISRSASSALDDGELDAFCTTLVAPTVDDARTILLRAQERGASHETLCLSYIAAAARRLGEWWEEDRIHFSDTAIAAGRMLHILRDLRSVTPPEPTRGMREALFATVPGEQHLIGVTMAADILRSKGWSIDLQLGRNEAELCKIARDGGYAIIGLSASGAESVRSLASTIVELRVAAPRAYIFIGGNISDIERNVMERTGADAVAASMDECLDALETLYQAVISPGGPAA